VGRGAQVLDEREQRLVNGLQVSSRERDEKSIIDVYDESFEWVDRTEWAEAELSLHDQWIGRR
jgi:hypothetical protein